jgi:hypothetical protein
MFAGLFFESQRNFLTPAGVKLLIFKHYYPLINKSYWTLRCSLGMRLNIFLQIEPPCLTAGRCFATK